MFHSINTLKTFLFTKKKNKVCSWILEKVCFKQGDMYFTKYKGKKVVGYRFKLQKRLVA